MAKKNKKTQEQPEREATAVKSSEQIAAEIAGNSMKPVVGAVVVFIAVGIVLMIMSSQKAAQQEETAKGYEKLDVVTLRQSGVPTYMRTTEAPEDLAKYASQLKELRESGSASDAVKDALFFEAVIKFEQKKYDDAAQKFVDFYTTYPARLPLADFARLNAVNSYINIGTAESVEKALKIAESVTASSDEISDKLLYQKALCNMLIGGDKLKDAKGILEMLSATPAEGEPKAIAGAAENLLTLIETANPDDLKMLATGFPPSMVQRAPEKGGEIAPKVK